MGIDMTALRDEGLWNDIQTICETQEGRQAIATTGAVIASAYLGYVGPDLFSAMHDAFVIFVEKYPLKDPAVIIENLWSGARYYAASALDFAADIIEGVGVDMSKTVRDSVNACRDFISREGQRGIDAARAAFSETSIYVGGLASTLVEASADAAKSGWEGVKNNWGAIIGVVAAAKQAYEYFETGESIYHRWINRAKKEVQEIDAKESATVGANISVNTALAGIKALKAADDQVKRSAVATKIDVNLDKILWVSEEIYDRLEAEAEALTSLMQIQDRDNTVIRRETPEGLDIDLSVLDPKVPGAPREPISIHRIDGEPILKSPEMMIDGINFSRLRLADAKKTDISNTRWSESPDSAQRLKSLSAMKKVTGDVTVTAILMEASRKARRKSPVASDAMELM